jgi:hypothetical protein
MRGADFLKSSSKLGGNPEGISDVLCSMRLAFWKHDAREGLGRRRAAPFGVLVPWWFSPLAGGLLVAFNDRRRSAHHALASPSTPTVLLAIYVDLDRRR